MAEFSILGNFDAFMLGMQAEADRSGKDTKQLQKSIKDMAAKIDDNFRTQYDRLIPNIHILDADYTVRLLIRDIHENPTNYFSKLIDDEGYHVDISKDNLTEARVNLITLITPSVVSSIRAKVLAAVDTFHAKLPKGSDDPLQELSDLMKDNYNTLLSLLDSNVSKDVVISEVAKLGSQFRRSIEKIFGTKALLGIHNPLLGSSSTRKVFFSKNFADVSNKINPVINKAFKEALTASLNIGIKFNVSDKINVGSTIHFAHTALKNGSTVVLNSPAYAKLIFNTANAPASSARSPFSTTLRASDHFKIKTKHVNVALKVSKDILSSTNILMQLGITFTTDHAASLNLAMGVKESKYSSGEYGSAAASSKALRTHLSSRRASEIISKILGSSPIEGTSSPSALKMIEGHLVNLISGKKIPPKKVVTTKSKTTKLPIVEFSKSKLNIPKTPITGSRVNKPAIPTIHTLQGQFYSLANLQMLLNAQLQHVIAANMGNGSDRGVLNYRTGRFAESAQVERLSQSREGMITAFYSYMKNPYQTFEPGFKQGSPRTRDPKLLISQSIREIAATKVGNKLRAVSI